MNINPPLYLLWPVPDYMAAKGSPGRPADIPVVRSDKERHRQLARPHKRRSQRPTCPRPSAAAPSEPRPTMPHPTA
jgi:hypothetical protein